MSLSTQIEVWYDQIINYENLTTVSLLGTFSVIASSYL